jgi:hypothetical protein
MTRPPRTAAPEKFMTLSTRVSVSELRVVEAAAGQVGVTKSSYVRLCLGLDKQKHLQHDIAAPKPESGDEQ